MSKYEGNMAAVRIELLIIRRADTNGNALFFSGRDAALRRPWFFGIVSACGGRRSAPPLP
jgi:hypothetical protein